MCSAIYLSTVSSCVCWWWQWHTGYALPYPYQDTHFELPAASLHHFPLEQTLMVHPAFNVSVFLTLQLGQDGFYYGFLVDAESIVGCCPAHQVISHPIAPNTCMSRAVYPCYGGNLQNFEFGSSFMVQILSMLCKSNRIVACIACCFASHMMAHVGASISIIMLEVVIVQDPWGFDSHMITCVAASMYILMLEVVIVQGKLPNPIPLFVPWVTDPSVYMMPSYGLEYVLIYSFTSESALPAVQSWHSLLNSMCA